MMIPHLSLRHALAFGLFAGSVVLMQGCVSRAEFQKSDIRIRQDLGKLKEQILAEGESIRRDQADIKADQTELETEVQELRGQCSLGQHEEDEAARGRQAIEESWVLQLSGLQRDMQAIQQRMDRIEGFLGLEKKEVATNQSVGVVPGPTPNENPAGTDGGESDIRAEDAYEAAFRLHEAKQYEQARKAFERFVDKYPASPLRGNAFFWTGETYYRTGDYEKAILSYQQVLKNYPKGAKAPDALLKMGYALEKIGEKPAALEAFEKLVKDYPKSSQVNMARRRIQQLGGGGQKPKSE